MSTIELTAADLYRRAGEACEELICSVKDRQWEADTPCEGWTVRDLVNHLVGENRWMPPLLAGLTIAEVGTQLDGDLLGDDPVQAWKSAFEAARNAAVAAKDSDRPVQLSFGESPTQEYLIQVGADHLVHLWDLASAIGTDRTLDGELVAQVSRWFADHESGYRSAGAIGPRPSLPADAGPQAKLLAMFGRIEPSGDAVDAPDAVDRFGTAFDAKDVDAVMAAMTEDCIFESTAPPDGVRYQGQEQVGAAWTQFFADSAGAEFQTEGRFACGDRVVVQWRYDWGGDEPGHVRGVDIFRVANGLVAEKVSYVKG